MGPSSNRPTLNTKQNQEDIITTHRQKHLIFCYRGLTANNPSLNQHSLTLQTEKEAHKLCAGYFGDGEHDELVSLADINMVAEGLKVLRRDGEVAPWARDHR